MANYIYLRQSSDPVKFVDLVLTTILGHIQLYIYKDTPVNMMNDLNKEDIILQPLLIMDAPENLHTTLIALRSAIHDISNPEAAVPAIDREITKYISVPFKHNEQVYTYLQSKGIKPEPEMLIQFDGEVEIKYFMRVMSDNFEGAWVEISEQENYTNQNYETRKVAIIKDTEVKQESEIQKLKEVILKNVRREYIFPPIKGGQHAVGIRTHKQQLISDELRLKIEFDYHKTDMRNWEVMEEILNKAIEIIYNTSK